MRNSAQEPVACNPGSIWITGLSSAGKSTLAQLLVGRLRGNGYPCMLLDGDQIRGIFEERLGYDPDSRRRQTRRVLGLTKWVCGQGILPVVAIIHPFEDGRIMCRNSLQGYFEVYLNCGIEECRRRDTKGVYRVGSGEDNRNVVGMDIPFDTPLHADLVLESGQSTPEEMLETLWQRVEPEVLTSYSLRMMPA